MYKYFCNTHGTEMPLFTHYAMQMHHERCVCSRPGADVHAGVTDCGRPGRAEDLARDTYIHTGSGRYRTLWGGCPQCESFSFIDTRIVFFGQGKMIFLSAFTVFLDIPNHNRIFERFHGYFGLAIWPLKRFYLFWWVCLVWQIDWCFLFVLLLFFTHFIHRQ